VSGIAGLFNVPETQADWSTWTFIHSAHHRDIAAAIFQQLSLTVPDAILDPVDISDEGWLERHQAIHFAMDVILGIASYNLDEVDLTNKDEREAWVFLNAVEHRQAAGILGID
jgi:hypothetical protein